MEWYKGFEQTTDIIQFSDIYNKSEIDTLGPIWSPPLVWKDKIIYGDWNGTVVSKGFRNNENDWTLHTAGSIYASIKKLGEKHLLICNDAGEMIKVSEDGKIKWKLSFKASLHSTPFITKCFIIATCYDHHLYKIDIETGEIIDKEIFNEKVDEDIYSSPFVDLDKNLIIFGTNTEIVCIDLNHFTQIWNYETNGIIDSTVAASNDDIYFGNESCKFYCLDKRTGKVNWVINTENKINSSAIIIDNKLIFGDVSGTLYCINKDNGNIIWKNNSYQSFYYCTFCSIDLKTIAFVTNGYVYIVDVKNGNILFKSNFEGVGLHSMPTLAKGNLYIGSHYNKIAILGLI